VSDGPSVYEERIDGTLTRIEEYMAKSADSFEFSRNAAEDAKAARAAAEGVAHEIDGFRQELTGLHGTLREHAGKFSDLEALTDGLRLAFENQARYFEANKEVIEFVKELRAGFPLLWEYMREVISERTRAKEAAQQHDADVVVLRPGQHP
jgi:hypothetical protein